MDNLLRIAVQSKGRLYDDTMELLKEAGIKQNVAKRTLLVPARNFPVEFLFLRDDDIPEAVASGTADIGIVGLNEVEEKDADVRVLSELGFSRCRLSLAIPQFAGYSDLSWFEGKKIATSYPGILRRFLDEERINAQIHVIMGSVEIAPGIGLADGIFDIVSSGSTLVSNNLEEVYTVMQSQAVLIGSGSESLPPMKEAILQELLFRIDAVKAADGKKYVLMNVPADKVDEVLAVLPGIKSPTVLHLADPSWRSVHTVIEEKRFWEIIGRLRAAGAEGILALDIEKMIL